MSSSSAPTAAATATSPTAPSEPAPSATPQRDTPPQEKTPLPLPSPSADTTATQLAVDGAGVKLDHLGPLVVNKDGSLSRIANWETMADVERANTLRILGKRNQLRLGGLKGEEGEGEGK
ncbi:hypothetical protein ST47_g3984 [Ascochyta rabiei]|uniref:Uncharacterized protein n=1 Tax=Didymella rabiei TaxID=5454 RepID=A0A163GJN1_DIDRA|nr:hypothetical protein ST47_g3984 [Ascochyta rabiei]